MAKTQAEALKSRLAGRNIDMEFGAGALIEAARRSADFTMAVS